jgi:tetratricopeptide (TPR) repeat protein
MRVFVLTLALAMALTAAASAQPSPKPTPAPGGDSKTEPAKPPTRPRATLDDLFKRLAGALTEREAGGIASLIERRWAHSGSDTADLLMARAGEAIGAKNYPLAVEILDRVIVLEPGWAEAWNRRATTFYLLDDPVSAMADIRQVLAREPRHFGAWAGLGHIYMSTGDKKRAVEAYRRALAIHPHLSSVKTIVERTAPEVEGRDL